MRVLVVQESDWIERGPHQSHHLMERLSEKGHEIRVIDYEIGWRSGDSEGLRAKRKVFEHVHKALENGDVTVIRPSFIRLPVLDYTSLFFTHRAEIKKQLDEFKPDVVIGFGILNASIAIELAHQRSIPFVYYIIDELHRLLPEKALQAIARSVETSNMKRSDAVICINEGLRDYSIKMGANPQTIEIIRAGVDLERFMYADGVRIREELGIGEKDIVLFFMGWLYEFSGLKEVALEVAKGARDDVKLLILGKGELWDAIQDIKREYDADERIITVGWRPYNEVPSYVAASNICLLPAYRNEIMENIVPIKIYEYMAAGKCVIATDLPGLRREFGDGSGVCYVNIQSEVLSLALKLIEEGKADVGGLEALRFVQGNDWNTMTSRFEEILNSIQSSGGMPPFSKTEKQSISAGEHNI